MITTTCLILWIPESRAVDAGGRGRELGHRPDALANWPGPDPGAAADTATNPPATANATTASVASTPRIKAAHASTAAPADSRVHVAMRTYTQLLLLVTS